MLGGTEGVAGCEGSGCLERGLGRGGGMRLFWCGCTCWGFEG